MDRWIVLLLLWSTILHACRYQVRSNNQLQLFRCRHSLLPARWVDMVSVSAYSSTEEGPAVRALHVQLSVAEVERDVGDSVQHLRVCAGVFVELVGFVV